MRPAFYAGSVLALMPAMGVQLPIGFALCLLLRTNFMVMGGLQFITNPATFWAVYPITYQVGRFVISNVGLGTSPEPEALPPGFSFAPGATESGAPGEGVLGDNEDGAPRTAWTSRLGTAFNALLLGGLILGTVLGGILDLLWRWLVLPAAKLRAARKPVTAIITPHEPPPTPPTEP